MKIKYTSVSVNPPPLDKKIIIKKDSDAHTFDNGARIVILSTSSASLEWHCQKLICDGYTKWAEV